MKYFFIYEIFTAFHDLAHDAKGFFFSDFFFSDVFAQISSWAVLQDQINFLLSLNNVVAFDNILMV